MELKKEKQRLFNYPGCKIKFVDQINSIIDRSDASNYYELFCGTATVRLNLTNNFERYYLNDLSKEVIRIIKSFRDGAYEQLAEMYVLISDEFGDIQHSKEAYYNFRDKYNERYFNSDTLYEGFYLYIVSRASINSLFRVGPSGFNQSFGNRGGKLNLTEEDFGIVKAKLNNTTISMEDYFSIMKSQLSSDENLFFLDPPYSDRKIKGSYKDEDAFDGDLFLERIRDAKANIVYTDILNDRIIDALPGWKYEVMSEKKNVSPGRNVGDRVDFSEAIYYNF